MADPSEGLSHHMSDAFSVVEMSLEDPSKKSPFLAALTGHGTARTTNHVATELAHKVVHDTRFVEVHIQKKHEQNRRGPVRL